jgi:polar amino acid transport system permease protein
MPSDEIRGNRMKESKKIIPAPVEGELPLMPGEEPGARMDPWWGLVIAVIALAVLLVVFIPDPYRRITFFVWDGIAITLTVTIVSFLLVIFLGLIGGLGRLSKNRIIYGVSSLYVEIVRGVPLLVQLMSWYYAMPAVVQSIGKAWNISLLSEFRMDALATAIFGITFCYGAYMSEIYRAGIQSIPKGQMEAARSLGMSYAQTMRHIILPQAVRVILPPVGNEFISLLKDSSLVSVVAVADLTRRGREFSGQAFLPIETWLMVALLYLIMTLFSARLVSFIERFTRFER